MVAGKVDLVFGVGFSVHNATVPLLKLAHHLLVDLTLIVEEVGPLVDIDGQVEQMLQSLTIEAYGGYNGRTQEHAQGLIVEHGAFGLHGVKLVQSYDDTQVHVEQLGRYLHAALKVGGIDDADDNIGRIAYKVAAYGPGISGA